MRTRVPIEDEKRVYSTCATVNQSDCARPFSCHEWEFLAVQAELWEWECERRDLAEEGRWEDRRGVVWASRKRRLAAQLTLS